MELSSDHASPLLDGPDLLQDLAVEELSRENLLILRSNLARIRERIEDAAHKARRPPAAIRLVCVTKKVRPEAAAALRELGAEDLGESRPAELRRLRGLLGGDIRWHLIGHVQRRGVKAALEAELIHSVDRLNLLDYLGSSMNCPPILLQINISGEPSKQGFAPEKAAEALDRARLLGLEVKGLMTMAPRAASETQLRGHFARLRELRDTLAGRGLPLDDLSMGMSNDFEAAIREGATLVRVGTALFEGLGAGINRSLPR